MHIIYTCVKVFNMVVSCALIVCMCVNINIYSYMYAILIKTVRWVDE